MLRVFVGYDSRQPVAFHVAAQSILANCTQPVCITPLVLETLPITRQGLTPFTWTRFLVPWLCDYQGQALFIDSDFMCRADIAPLFELPRFCDVYCVLHQGERKFERASLMLFNNERCKILTPEYVATAPNLHGCGWAQSVGQLRGEWNHLVGYDAPSTKAKMVHFTQGLPCFPKTCNDEYAKDWGNVAQACISTASWETLMGHSVHAPYVEKRNNEVTNVS